MRGAVAIKSFRADNAKPKKQCLQLGNKLLAFGNARKFNHLGAAKTDTPVAFKIPAQKFSRYRFRRTKNDVRDCAPGGFYRQDAEIFKERHDVARMNLECLVRLFAARARLSVKFIQPAIRKNPLPALLKFVDPALIRIAKLYFFFIDSRLGEQSAQNVRQILVQFFGKNLDRKSVV